MLFLVSNILVFLAVATFFYAYFGIDKSEDLDKKSGIEGIRQWSEETQLIKAFVPLTKIFKPLTDLIPVPSFIERRYQGWIVSSGFEVFISVRDLISLQFALCVLGFLLANFALEGINIVVVTVLGFFFPVLWVHQAAKERRLQILRELPSAVDAIALSVGAGLEFNESIARLLKQQSDSKTKVKSPLMMELRIYLQNVRIGMGRSEALTEMANRIDNQDIHSFTGILIQADKMGASISETLIQQSARIREERFVAAEKAGAVASQKMMLPMMIFVFPLVFAIIILPMVLQYIFSS